jgi:NAD(P)-dependent dehydrogenase (short-subunit alcohol dehydrogenase family)
LPCALPGFTFSTRRLRRQSNNGGIPQRRLGHESDLDGAIVLLVSNASRYMTGSVVTVDGGFLLA